MSAPEAAHARCCLLATCGLPGAGKSTLCASLAAHAAAQPNVQCILVSFDAFERQLAAGDDAFDAARWKARPRLEARALIRTRS